MADDDLDGYSPEEENTMELETKSPLRHRGGQIIVIEK